MSRLPMLMLLKLVLSGVLLLFSYFKLNFFFIFLIFDYSSYAHESPPSSPAVSATTHITMTASFMLLRSIFILE